MVEECRYHTVGVWRNSNTYGAGQHNSKTGTLRNEPGFGMGHRMYVLALPSLKTRIHKVCHSGEHRVGAR